jgi:hypothetical protein
MATDFVDDDLLRPAPTNPAASAHPGGAYERVRRRVEEDESRASDEIERIRKRSEEIERQRQALRLLRNRQLEFDRTQRELTEGLKRNIVLLKEEEQQASRAATVCHEIRLRFETLQEELDRIEPDAWKDATHEQELTQALAQLEAARAVFRKGVDRVAAIGWRPDEARQAPLRDALSEQGLASLRFGDWVRIGMALTLPLALLLALLLAAYLLAVHSGVDLLGATSR